MFRLISLALVLVTGAVFAHARLISPAPRNNSDLLKDPNAPCGNVLRTTLNTSYLPGALITVNFEETVNHAGCFAFALSQANDTSFTFLKMVPHSNVGALPRQYTSTVQLPAGVSCANCTLQQIQYMIAGYDGGVCPPANPVSGTRYYSCADIRIGAAIPDAGGTGGGAGGGAGGGTAGGAGGAAGGGAGGAAGGGAGGAAGGGAGGAAGGGAGGGTPVADAGSTGGGAGGSGGSSGGVIHGDGPSQGCSAMPIGGLAALALAIALRRRQR